MINSKPINGFTREEAMVLLGNEVRQKDDNPMVNIRIGTPGRVVSVAIDDDNQLTVSVEWRHPDVALNLKGSRLIAVYAYDKMYFDRNVEVLSPERTQDISATRKAQETANNARWKARLAHLRITMDGRER